MYLKPIRYDMVYLHASVVITYQMAHVLTKLFILLDAPHDWYLKIVWIKKSLYILTKSTLGYYIFGYL